MCCSVFIALKRSSTSDQLSLAIYSIGVMLPLSFLPSSFPFLLPILDPTIYGRRLPVDYPSTSLAFSSPFLVMAPHIYECLYEAAFLIIVNFWAPPHYIGLWFWHKRCMICDKIVKVLLEKRAPPVVAVMVISTMGSWGKWLCVWHIKVLIWYSIKYVFIFVSLVSVGESIWTETLQGSEEHQMV